MSSLVESVYISGGCNRNPKALDWAGNQDQLIYAQGNSVALLSNAEPFEIKCTFNKHTDKVNCVKWITANGFMDKSAFGVNEFVSASKDKTVVVWQGRDFNVGTLTFYIHKELREMHRFNGENDFIVARLIRHRK